MTLTEDRPIFQQIAEQLEEAILSGAYPEESQVPSITEYSVQYRINPATARGSGFIRTTSSGWCGRPGIWG